MKDSTFEQLRKMKSNTEYKTKYEIVYGNTLNVLSITVLANGDKERSHYFSVPNSGLHNLYKPSTLEQVHLDEPVPVSSNNL